MIRNGGKPRKGGDKLPGRTIDAPRPHRYRASRPWTVLLLAVIAAGGPVLVTAAVSETITEDGMALATVLTGPQRAPEWQIQLGTFERREAAEAHLRNAAATVPELRGRTLRAEPYGALTRARIAGFEDEAAARRACAAFEGGDEVCFVVIPD